MIFKNDSKTADAYSCIGRILFERYVQLFRITSLREKPAAVQSTAARKFRVTAQSAGTPRRTPPGSVLPACGR